MPTKRKKPELPTDNQILIDMLDELDTRKATKKTKLEIAGAEKVLEDPGKVHVNIRDKGKLEKFGEHLFERCKEIDTDANREVYFKYTGVEINQPRPKKKRKR